tara:strand:+ start:844 stop:1215 length:372 start_codon:yes stop_codon:yes gene_type:complete
VVKEKLLDVNIAERLQHNLNVQVVDLQDQTKMAQVIVTLQIMPNSPDASLDDIYENASKLIKEFCNESEFKREDSPVAFGLKALKITFVMDEEKGSTETLEEQIKEVENVQSVEVVDVRRTIG